MVVARSRKPCLGPAEIAFFFVNGWGTQCESKISSFCF